MTDIQVASIAHPFETRVERRCVAEGVSLADMLAEVQPDPVLQSLAYIEINGDPIPAENWARVRPKRGTCINIRIVPAGGGGGGGGGKNPLRTVLSIALLVTAVAVPQLAFPGIAGETLFGAFTVGQAITAGIPLLSEPVEGSTLPCHF